MLAAFFTFKNKFHLHQAVLSQNQNLAIVAPLSFCSEVAEEQNTVSGPLYL